MDATTPADIPLRSPRRRRMRRLRLLTQSEIIAGAIAASATVDSDTINIDPDRLLQMQAGESSPLGEEALSPLEFSLNPERVAPLLRRLVSPTRTRALIYDREGGLLLDSRNLYSRGDVLRFDLPPLRKKDESFVERTWYKIRGLFQKDRPPLEEIGPSHGKTLPEVRQALGGARATVVRQNARGETIVSVAVPVQRFRSVRGALLLSTQGGAIAGPVRRLAEAAERVRRGIKAREQIPDFTARSDEIGHLSGALREMTRALYSRIDAIERFAADVAHELKNPLTSLRSAVETLPLARSDESRGRLLAIVQHDVRRLDRLISDISDASRLDAELARADAEPVDMARLLDAVVTIANERRREHDPRIALKVEPHPMAKDAFFVFGHDSRLAQVFSNLVDNARSFSPADGTVRVSLRRGPGAIEVVVDDDGPGIPPHALERVFERFYTDRPDQGFGQNSGLGLSISRQIVEAHRGHIKAENRLGPPGRDGEPRRLGARFSVRLPPLG